MIIEFKGMRPDIEKAAYIAENATISGDVALGEGSSVWFTPLCVRKWLQSASVL